VTGLIAFATLPELLIGPLFGGTTPPK